LLRKLGALKINLMTHIIANTRACHRIAGEPRLGIIRSQRPTERTPYIARLAAPLGAALSPPDHLRDIPKILDLAALGGDEARAGIMPNDQAAGIIRHHGFPWWRPVDAVRVGEFPSLLILTVRVVEGFHDRRDTLQSHPVTLS
jgi:hypothetical protein